MRPLFKRELSAPCRHKQPANSLIKLKDPGLQSEDTDTPGPLPLPLSRSTLSPRETNQAIFWPNASLEARLTQRFELGIVSEDFWARIFRARNRLEFEEELTVQRRTLRHANVPKNFDWRSQKAGSLKKLSTIRKRLSQLMRIFIVDLAFPQPIFQILSDSYLRQIKPNGPN